MTEISKEVELIIKSIEEGSKHSRNLLLTLLVSSLYILLAAFSGDMSDKIKLPIINLEVNNLQFFLFSPLIILSLYLYLHIYVGDLRRKLVLFERFKLNLQHADFSSMLLFPWIVTMAFSDSSHRVDVANQSRNDEQTSFAMPKIYIRFTAIFSVWIFAPCVLFALWVRFVGQQRLISLIPCIAIIVSIYGSSKLYARNKTTKILAIIASFMLIGISFASVPELREFLPFDIIWKTTLTLANLILENLEILIVGIPMGFFIFLIRIKLASYENHRMVEDIRSSLQKWLEEYKTGKFGKLNTIFNFPYYLLYSVIVKIRSPHKVMRRTLFWLSFLMAALFGFILGIKYL